MRIGVLGSGDVGRTLARGFAARGHQVKLGSRDPSSEKIQSWLADSSGATAGTFAEAAEFGELLVLGTLWDGTENAIRLAQPAPFPARSCSTPPTRSTTRRDCRRSWR